MKIPSLLNRDLHRGDNRGIAVVYIALILVALLAITGLAIDIGYMYVAKTQLQNAADSSALAGAAKLDGSDDILQLAARQEAWKFACKNSTAKQKVYLQTNTSTDCNLPPSNVSSLNGSNNAEGDIVVGNWNGNNFDPTRKPVNAVKTTARRSGEAAGIGMPSVPIFFGRIIGYPAMAVRATSTAIISPKPILALPICLPNCNRLTPVDAMWDFNKNEDLDVTNNSPILCTDNNSSTSNPPGQRFYLNPSATIDDPSIPGTSWTNFYVSTCAQRCGSNNPTPKEMADLVIGNTKTYALCNVRICNTNGDFTTVLNKEFSDMFSNNQEEYIFQTGSITTEIKGWQVYLVVLENLACGGGSLTQSCPGDPNGNPYLIKRYTKVLITEVVTTGAKGFRVIALPRNAKPGSPINTTRITTTVSCNDGSKTIDRYVTSFDCVPCDEVSNLIRETSLSRLVK